MSQSHVQVQFSGSRLVAWIFPVLGEEQKNLISSIITYEMKCLPAMVVFLSCRSLCSSRGLIFQDAPAPPLISVNICLLNTSSLKVWAQLCSLLPTCSYSVFGQLFTVADAESWFLQEFITCGSDVLPLHSILEKLLPLKMNWIKPHWEPQSAGMAVQGSLL